MCTGSKIPKIAAARPTQQHDGKSHGEKKGTNWPHLGAFVAKFGCMSASVSGQFWPTFGRLFANIWPIFGRFWPILPDFGRIGPDFGRFGGRTWADSRPIWGQFFRVCQKVALEFETCTGSAWGIQWDTCGFVLPS